MSNIAKSVESYDSMKNSKDMLKGLKRGENTELFKIIFKQTGKITELKMKNAASHLPVTIMNHINFLACALEEKEKKVISLSETNKSLNIELKEAKQAKIESQKEVRQKQNMIETLKNDVATIEASKLPMSKEIEKLKREEEQLNTKIKILEEAASVFQIDDIEERVEIVEQQEGSKHDKENDVCLKCPKRQKRVESLVKENTVLIDKSKEMEIRFRNIDNSYMQVVEQKERTIKTCLEITENGDFEGW